MTRTLTRSMLTLAACASLCGCMKKMTVAEMKAMMDQPRPAELDHLNMFVGKWESDGEAHMAMVEGPLKVHGISEFKWSSDNRYLEEHAEFHMADFQPHLGTGVWLYDAKHKEFRACFGGGDMIGVADATYDAATRTWHMDGKGEGPMGTMHEKGTLKFIDNNTMEMKWSGRSGLMKVMEMSVTAHRKS